MRSSPIARPVRMTARPCWSSSTSTPIMPSRGSSTWISSRSGWWANRHSRCTICSRTHATCGMAPAITSPSIQSAPPPMSSASDTTCAASGTSTTLPDVNVPTAAHPRDPLWYKDAVIDEVHVRAFADSNNDGIGDFPGLTGKLDSIQDLGVNAIWLLPFYPSPLRDDGYDIADYRNIHPQYG